MYDMTGNPSILKTEWNSFLKFILNIYLFIFILGLSCGIQDL